MARNNLLEVDESEWEYVNNYIKNHPKTDFFKISRKDSDELKHSFVVFDGVPVALAVGEILGKGGFGKVKVGQLEDGSNVAIKIEAASSSQSEIESYKKEMEILKIMKHLIAYGIIKKEKAKMDKHLNKLIKDKRYLKLKLIEGKDLSVALKSMSKGDFYMSVDFNSLKKEEQHLMIANGASKALQEVHKRGIIHRDVKPANFMINIKDPDEIISEKNEIVAVTAIDYGLSEILEDKEEITRKLGGTNIYLDLFRDEAFEQIKIQRESEKILDEMKALKKLEPAVALQKSMELKFKHEVLKMEITDLKFRIDEKWDEYRDEKKEMKYTEKSDIYALGIMFKLNLRLDYPIVDQMLDADPEKRPSIEVVLEEIQKIFVKKNTEEALRYGVTTKGNANNVANEVLKIFFKQGDKFSFDDVMGVYEFENMMKNSLDLEFSLPKSPEKTPTNSEIRKNLKIALVVKDLEAAIDSGFVTKKEGLHITNVILKKLRQKDSKESESFVTSFLNMLYNFFSKKETVKVFDVKDSIELTAKNKKDAFLLAVEHSNKNLATKLLDDEAISRKDKIDAMKLAMIKKNYDLVKIFFKNVNVTDHEMMVFNELTDDKKMHNILNKVKVQKENKEFSKDTETKIETKKEFLTQFKVDTERKKMQEEKTLKKMEEVLEEQEEEKIKEKKQAKVNSSKKIGRSV